MAIEAGLCARCVWAKPLTTKGGATLYLCGLSERDPRYPKYPPLPVRSCLGFREMS
jgi:hypothetical protein